jgi:hypothetical protein
LQDEPACEKRSAERVGADWHGCDNHHPVNIPFILFMGLF